MVVQELEVASISKRICLRRNAALQEQKQVNLVLFSVCASAVPFNAEALLLFVFCTRVLAYFPWSV
jgi:hypothetical protein